MHKKFPSNNKILHGLQFLIPVREEYFELLPNTKKLHNILLDLFELSKETGTPIRICCATMVKCEYPDLYVEHPNIINIGYRPFSEIEDMVENGKLINLTLAAHLAHVGRVIRGERTGILVSPGIPKNIAEKLGFYYTKTVQDALELSLKIKGNDAKVVVIKNGGSVMPIIK